MRGWPALFRRVGGASVFLAVRRGASRVRAAALIACLLPALAGAVAAESDVVTPDDVVQRLHTSLLEAMRNAARWGYAGRRERLEPVIDDSLDLPFMTAVAVGRRWNGLDEADRESLVEAFRAFTVANYAARFNGYSGQRFEILAVDEQPRGRRLVRTRIIKADGEAIALDYLLHRPDRRWRIIDVFLAGRVSELATRRSEFASVLKRGGVGGLLDTLEAGTAKLATGAVE